MAPFDCRAQLEALSDCEVLPVVLSEHSNTIQLKSMPEAPFDQEQLRSPACSPPQLQSPTCGIALSGNTASNLSQLEMIAEPNEMAHSQQLHLTREPTQQPCLNAEPK